MVSKSLLVLLVVALVAKNLHVLAAPAPEPAPQPMLGYLMWSQGIAHGLASGMGLYGLMDSMLNDDDKPMIIMMPQDGSAPIPIALGRNGRNNGIQIIQLPSTASTVQSLG